MTTPPISEAQPAADKTKPIVLHPLQRPHGNQRSMISSLVTLRAYEVYRFLFGDQVALIEGHCRGGFGCGELAAFLYARTFPKTEWRQRFDEAIEGQVNM